MSTLGSAMSGAGFIALGRCEYPLPNGKTLIRQDFRPTLPADEGLRGYGH